MGETGKGPGSSNSLQRVKLYRLNGDGKWDDQGTGHVSIDFLERSGNLGLIVVDEEDNDTILMHPISSNEMYRRQEETIISWQDSETEVALSFQEASCCSYIWDHICGVQRNLHFSALSNLDVSPRPTIETLEAAGCSHSNDESFNSANNELRELPSVEMSTLPLLLKTVFECGVTDQIRVSELILQDPDFFPKLLDLFNMSEDLENVDELHMIFRLVKGIILLNSLQIFDRIFRDEFILDIIGCLEYDPEVPQVQRHRAFLKEHVIFKEAIPIKDPFVLSKIHQTYRIGYIKDVILPRVLDEGTIATLNGIITANNAAVVSLLKDDNTFIQELFARMRSDSIPHESKRNLVLFLHEFCSLSRSLPLVQQLQLFRDLANEGVFDIITNTLQSDDRKLLLTGTDILILFLNQDPVLLRSYIIQQEGHTLLGLLVKGMMNDFGEEMHCQFLEIVRILLDTYSLTASQRDTIVVEIFYEKHLDQLMDVIASSCPPKVSYGRLHSHAVTKPEILSNICELLCFCVLHHPYRIKSSFLSNNAIEKVLSLTHRREKSLVIAAVRFMRAIISRNDEHLHCHIVKNNLLKPIMDVFFENGNRYNMLHSVVLELFEYICKNVQENYKTLIVYIFDSFWERLMRFQHLGSIRAFRTKYEQSLENFGIKNTANAAGTKRRIDEQALEKEEAYFKENRSLSGGLVDYEDDDDEEEDNHKPPRMAEASTRDNENRKPVKSKRKSVSKVEIKDELELSKKQRLDQCSGDDGQANVTTTSSPSSCTDNTSNTVQSPDITPQIPSDKGNSDKHSNENENPAACSQHNCLPETADIKQPNIEDCPLTPMSSSSPEIVVNSANSEPYSVR
ncbi:Protein predicted to be involved in carbohydrate metabolism protein [Dioscorea alata]|uniref:Protein predicted to be involved in carbohydrate metabolism protein n=2 Tax=Dioscorea alata TaxID=55571 RepID=A0ACB7VQ44_DIOAL|nr:Protein predicted to be involved in carbohydrate metabolism protein [Dioscorea alata]